MLRDARHEREEGAAPRYVAAPPAALRIVALDSLTAIFHRASGITHLVESPVPELLDLLREPMTADALLERLASAYDMIDPDVTVLAERLAELEAVGLIERA